MASSWKYAAFLNFRGEDTRKTFVGHLYSALVQQGIHVYKDDETLDRGKPIGESLLKAIEESRIAITIFSQNYADSCWCLNELEHIMECMNSKGQIVIPVFYDVVPALVRRQKESYQKAFAKHEAENKHKVESWRKALSDASHLHGHERKRIASGQEAECIKRIVDDISERWFPEISHMGRGLVGIESRLQELKSKIEMERHDVRMVGIWGIGGGGKTTIASCVYMEIRRLFDGHCLVENIREESHRYGLSILQEKILSSVLKTKIILHSVEEGRHMMKSRFGEKKVLIVLDDVDDLEQLEALAASRDWFGKGSRIIITTRDKHLLKAHKVDVVSSVQLFSRKEANELFRIHAYREKKPLDDFETLSGHVVSYANGIPLALKILGSFLYDKDKNEWKSALAKLENIPTRKIMEKLKISYDELEPKQKKLFLKIACSEKEIKELMGEHDDSDFHTVIGVKMLMQKSLITIVDGKFGMHDLVRAMGRHIDKQERPKNAVKHRRDLTQKDVLSTCAMEEDISAHLINETDLSENSVRGTKKRKSSSPDVLIETSSTSRSCHCLAFADEIQNLRKQMQQQEVMHLKIINEQRSVVEEQRKLLMDQRIAAQEERKEIQDRMLALENLLSQIHHLPPPPPV